MGFGLGFLRFIFQYFAVKEIKSLGSARCDVVVLLLD